MFNTPTTFIIGAGASLELGFPTSHQLKSQIAEAVNIGFDYGSIIRGDRDIAKHLDKYADHRFPETNKEYNDYIAAGWHISKAMPQAISIDNFVEAQEDDRVTRMAKLGIASCLITAEQESWQKYKKDNHPDEVLWAELEDTWMHSFFQTLTEGLRLSKLDRVFDNLKFVIFNYDRSFEFLLASGLVNFYGIDKERSAALVQGSEIYHPYGQIGQLPFQANGTTVQQYGSSDKRHLFEISQSILTFSEQVEDGERLKLIRAAVEWSEQLVFLGFSFNETNMQLLRPAKRTSETQRVLATGYGISDSDCQVIKKDIRELCMIDERPEFFDLGSCILDNSTTCAQFFNKYRRTLMS